MPDPGPHEAGGPRRRTITTPSAAASVPATPVTPRWSQNDFPGGQPWSPDGTRYVYGDRLLESGSGAATPLPCGRCCGSPSWATDTRLVFACEEGGLIYDVDTNVLRSFDHGFDTQIVRRGAELMWTLRDDDGGRQRKVLWAIDKNESVGDPLPSPAGTTWVTSDDGETALSIAPTGETALTRLASGDRTVIADDGVGRPDGRAPFRLFSPDSSKIALLRRSAGVSIIDVERRVPVGALTGPECDDAFNVDWTPDGRSVAVGTEAGRICLFDVQSGNLVRSWRVDVAPLEGPKHRDPDSSVLIMTFLMARGDAIVAGVPRELTGPGCASATAFRVQSGTAPLDLGIICRPRRAAGGGFVYEKVGGGTELLAADSTVVPEAVTHLGSTGELSDDGLWMVFPGSLPTEGSGGSRAIAVSTVTHHVVPLDDLSNGERLTDRLVIDPTGRSILGETPSRWAVWDMPTGHARFSGRTR